MKYADYEHAITTCLGMTVKELNDAVSNTENDIALYMVNADDSWNTTASYNADAGVIGFWCTKDGTIQNWGSGCLYFVQAVDGSLNIGRYEKIASGTTIWTFFLLFWSIITSSMLFFSVTLQSKFKQFSIELANQTT